MSQKRHWQPPSGRRGCQIGELAGWAPGSGVTTNFLFYKSTSYDGLIRVPRQMVTIAPKTMVAAMIEPALKAPTDPDHSRK